MKLKARLTLLTVGFWTSNCLAGLTMSVVHAFDGGSSGCTPVFGVSEASPGKYVGALASSPYPNKAYEAGNTNQLISSYGDIVVPPSTHGYVSDTSGTLWNVSVGGGNYGGGYVFKINSMGNVVPVYHFGGVPEDGIGPTFRLTLGSDGLLYGTTMFGGKNNDGTVFVIDPITENLRYLHSFYYYSEGTRPFGELLEGADGALYGVTDYGGPSPSGDKMGTVYRITKSGSSRVLHAFGPGTNAPGTPEVRPSGKLLQLPNGALVGVTSLGGKYGRGAAWTINPRGKYSVLFSYPEEFAGPAGGVVLGPKGKIYGIAHAQQMYSFGKIDGLRVEYSFPWSGYGVGALITSSKGSLVTSVPWMDTYQCGFVAEFKGSR